MKNYYLKIEDAEELLDGLIPDIRNWAEEKNPMLLNCNGITFEGGSVIKIDDIAAAVNITITTIKKWAKEKNKPLLICEEIPVKKRGKYRKVNEISEILGIPVVTIKKWVKANKIPHRYWMERVHLRFVISEVMKWANNRGQMTNYK